MNMGNLEFKGPFLLNDLVLQKGAYMPGIYIWGFVYDFSNPNETGSVDFLICNSNYNVNESGTEFANKNWKFIPYYVGKSTKNIVKRITEHKGDIIKHDSTYLRMTESYLKEFFKELNHPFPSFPIKTSNSQKLNRWDHWFDINYFLYINDKDFLVKVQGVSNPISCNKRQFPISNIKLNTDPLLDRINTNNFWICYAEVDDHTKVDEYLEATVFYSLKGKTISKTLKCPQTSYISSKLRCNDIFERDKNNVICSSSNFIGNY